jgi:hypothetical protein
MTTAKTTAFTYEVLEIAGLVFTFDGNQKVTADNGTFEEPQANAFSTVQVLDCPWSTPTCKDSCYVNNLEKFQPDIHDFYKRNSQAIRTVLDSYDCDTYCAVQDGFAKWIRENAAGGFRWHVSGDIFSQDYADFIEGVVRSSPQVQHWIYTRSFNFIEELVDIENLTVNLSADKDNYWLARKVATQYGLRVCYLTIDGEVPDDLKEGDVIFPDYALRGVGQKPFDFRNDSEWWQGLEGRNKKMVCPTDVYGKSEKVRCGPCRKCIE